MPAAWPIIELVLGRLGELDCIGSLHSIFVIGEVKNSRSIPLGHGK